MCNCDWHYYIDKAVRDYYQTDMNKDNMTMTELKEYIDSRIDYYEQLAALKYSNGSIGQIDIK